MSALSTNPAKPEPTARWENEGGAVPGAKPPPSAGSHLGQDDHIRARAYELFRSRVTSGRPGDDRSDWLQAEREIVAPATGTPGTSSPSHRDAAQPAVVSPSPFNTFRHPPAPAPVAPTRGNRRA
jgi:hypothetical protein